MRIYTFWWQLILADHSLPPCSEGTEIWVTAESAYNERVARVENQIIARLRDRLGTARNANEMFRVFSKFNALFVRQKVSLFLSHSALGMLSTSRYELDPGCN